MREFTRFYTNLIGLLDRKILNSKYSLPEARVLYEIANTPRCTAVLLADKLAIDKGYLSRILKLFESRRILERRVDSKDRRSTIIHLTKAGFREFRQINRASQEQFVRLLNRLSIKKQNQLTGHMRSIQTILRSQPLS